MRRNLYLLLILKQLIWMTFIPIWQFPDEQAHFGQVQNLVERRGRYIDPGANTSREIFESEKLLETLRDERGNNKFTYHPEFNIPYSQNKIGIYEEQIRNSPQEFRTDKVITEATGYPPLYYMLSSLFYRLSYSTDLLTRIFSVRLVNIFIFLTNIYIVEKIARLIFPRQELLQYTLILLVALHPMFSFVSAGINSDNLFNLCATVSLYLSLLLLLKNWHLRTVVIVVLTILLVDIVKPQGKLITLFYVYPLLIHFWNMGRKQMRLRTFLGILSVGILGFGFVLKNLFTNQQFISDLPILANFPNLSIEDFVSYLITSFLHTYREVLPWYWGIYRWLSLTYPRVVHRVINWTLVISGLGFLRYMYRDFIHKEKTLSIKISGFFMYVSIMYFLALIFFDYLFIRTHGYSFGIQGRYFFPTITAHMILVLVGIRAFFVPKRWSDSFIKLIGLGIILLHTYASYFVITSYYSTEQFQKFFVQASQYKPVLFKSFFLETILIFFGLSLTSFLWYYVHTGNGTNEKN